MSIQIDTTQFVDGIIMINGKEVYKDTNGNWIARAELTTNEHDAFRLHLKILEKS